MHFWAVVLGVQLALLVHAMRTQRDTIWVWILLLAPVVGAIAYFLVEFLPDVLDGRRAAKRRALRGVSTGKSGPERFETDCTVRDALAAAQQHYDEGAFQEGLSLVQRTLAGANRFQPDLMLELARMQFALDHPEAAINTLDVLRAKNPDYQSPQGHVLYARAKAAAGDIPGAIHEYEALCSYYAGPEPYVRFGDMLREEGDDARARMLYFSVLEESEQAGKLYTERHKQWVDAARKGYAATSGAAAPSGGA
ncbi:MAG: tetratricopeptide repeat protein [Pseudomonadota bacterium]